MSSLYGFTMNPSKSQRTPQRLSVWNTWTRSVIRSSAQCTHDSVTRSQTIHVDYIHCLEWATTSLLSKVVHSRTAQLLLNSRRQSIHPGPAWSDQLTPPVNWLPSSSYYLRACRLMVRHSMLLSQRCLPFITLLQLILPDTLTRSWCSSAGNFMQSSPIFDIRFH